MLNNSTEFIDFIQLLSYNAIFNFVDTVRNTGKTTKAKAWLLARYLKRHKKAIWVRTFEGDIKSCKKDFYTEHKSKPIKIVNDLGYDVKADNIVQDGEYIYYVTFDEKGKIKTKDWFIRLIHLSQAQSIKGNEIPTCDIIIYDEYRTKENRINRYIGNQAKDFIDIVYSIARDHTVRSILLGNKETYNNPFYDYLRIKQPKEDFEGIKSYKGGSIAIMQINTVPNVIAENSMNKRLKKALTDTPIMGYLYDGLTEGINRSQIVKMPKSTYYACGFSIGGCEFSAKIGYDNKVYFQSGLDPYQHVYVDDHTTKYKFCEKIMKQNKKQFNWLMTAYKYNNVYFCDVGVYERANKIIESLI